jgi:hypothetical protein
MAGSFLSNSWVTSVGLSALDDQPSTAAAANYGTLLVKFPKREFEHFWNNWFSISPGFPSLLQNCV